MTNQEAIEILKLYKQRLDVSCSNLLGNDKEAFDLAIKALEDQPKGKWEYTTHHARQYRVCPLCKAEKEDDHATGWNFCQYCGARMER